jgi:hypothetical protein
MSDRSDNPQLLRSLGKLARGLSALFWGLPASLIICAETVQVDILRPLGVLPTLAINALILFGLWQMDDFQKQERPWRKALDRAKLLALVNLGLSPFLYWYSRQPDQPLFFAAVIVLFFSALLFLFNLNVVLRQLGAMLPDETLRQETRHFTALNRWLIVSWIALGAVVIALPSIWNPATHLSPPAMFWLQHIRVTIQLVLGLAPLAITMALLWKAKEVILDSVFGSRQ